MKRTNRPLKKRVILLGEFLALLNANIAIAIFLFPVYTSFEWNPLYVFGIQSEANFFSFFPVMAGGAALGFSLFKFFEKNILTSRLAILIGAFWGMLAGMLVGLIGLTLAFIIGKGDIWVILLRALQVTAMASIAGSVTGWILALYILKQKVTQ